MSEYEELLEGIKKEGEINHALLDQVMVDHLKHSTHVVAGQEMQNDSDAKLIEAILGSPT